MNLSDKAYNKELNFVVALDGPSASGKGHIGSIIAKEFSLTYFSSSIVYRGLAYICLQKNIPVDEEKMIIGISAGVDIFTETKNIDLNEEIIGNFASKIAVIPQVRENLGLYLKRLVKTTPRIIMEGRDIGTVIAPEADLKIYITASAEVRAKRRYKQLLTAQKDCILSDVLEQLLDRDKRDMSRSSAPLVPAGDAHIIDTTCLTPDEVLRRIKEIIGKAV